MISPFSQLLTLLNWPADHFAPFLLLLVCLVCLFVFLVCFCFASLWFSLFCSTGIVTAPWTMYRSYTSSTFVANPLEDGQRQCN